MTQRTPFVPLFVFALIIGAAFLLIAEQGSAQDPDVLCVAPDGSPEASGSCWDAPLDLSTAMSNADPGSQIWLQQGTYVPGDNVHSAFYLPDGVDLTGGFTGSTAEPDERSDDPSLTSLDGEDSRYSILIVAGISDASISGISVTNGAATLIADEATDLQRRGGGIYISNSSVTIENVGLQGNQARFGGGGMYIDEASDVELNDVVFRDNQTTHPQSGRGGGLRVRSGSASLSKVTFEENGAFRGGGLFVDSGHVEIRDSRFQSNEAADRGGGISVYSGSLSLAGTQFNNNVAFREGAGLFVSRAGNSIEIEKSTFVENMSGDGGAGAWIQASEIRIDRSQFSSNSAGVGPGGGLYIGNASAELTSLHVQGNQAGMGGGLVIRNTDAEVINCLITGNLAGPAARFIDPDAGRPPSDEQQREHSIADPWRAIITGEAFNSDYLLDSLDERAERAGGGMLLYGEGQVSLVNVTITANQSERLGAAIYHAEDVQVSIANGIMFNNHPAESDEQEADGTLYLADPPDSDENYVEISHSILEPDCQELGAVSCQQVSRDDPRFRRSPDTADLPSDGGDFRLWFTSPAIDAGRAELIDGRIDHDLEGQPRRVEKRPDNSAGSGIAVLDLGALETQIPEHLTDQAVTVDHQFESEQVNIDVETDSIGVMTGVLEIETQEITIEAFRPGRLYREEELLVIDGEALLESYALAGIIVEYDAEGDSIRITLDTGASTGWIELD